MGGSTDLTVTVRPDNATDDRITALESSNSSVILVSGTKASAVGAGEATVTAKAANGVSASVTFHVLPADYLELEADLPARTAFLYTKSSLYGETGPSDPRQAGALEITAAAWSKGHGKPEDRYLIVTGRVLSLDEDLKDPLPYFRYLLRDEDGAVVCEGYRSLSGKPGPGDPFEESIYVSKYDLTFGSRYTVEFFSEEGQTRTDREAARPEILLPDLPFTVPDRFYRDGPRGNLTIRDVEVELDYSSYGDEYNARFRLTGEADLFSTDRVPHYSFYLTWYLLDSSGEKVTPEHKEIFLSVQQGDYDRELGRAYSLKPGETYRLVFQL